MDEAKGLVGTLVGLPIFEAEWVLWLLILLSLISVTVMVERAVFYRRHAVNGDEIRLQLAKLLDAGDYAGAAEFLQKYDSLETNVVLFGLREYRKGPDAVEDLLTGAESKERMRYNRRLSFLATVGSNAPFIGLFGTVLGIIRAFQDLGANFADASGTVMAGIAEALIATAVGLLVAIPAVVAYNYFVGVVKDTVSNSILLSKTLLSQLKSEASAKES